MELDMQTIGLRIKSRRKELKLTQTDIKTTTGISSGNMSDIENGKRLPAASTLVQLADTLHCSIDWILTGISPTSENLFFSDVGDEEYKLLYGFRQLSQEDKDEFIEILEMKLRKLQKSKGTNPVKSSQSSFIENSHMVG